MNHLLNLLYLTRLHSRYKQLHLVVIGYGTLILIVVQPELCFHTEINEVLNVFSVTHQFWMTINNNFHIHTNSTFHVSRLVYYFSYIIRITFLSKNDVSLKYLRTVLSINMSIVQDVKHHRKFLFFHETFYLVLNGLKEH